MYKCIRVAFGVDISVNRSSFFHFDIKTHMVTDLGEGKVRITRRIDGLHELYTSNATDYTDVDGNVISTTAAGLTDYFSIGAEGVKAGEGVAVNNGAVSVVAGGPSTLGGYKVGTGLMVDGTGKLSATAASEVTKVLATEAEMLSLATEMLRPYRIIRLDTKKLYYLNAGVSPSVLANWFVGPSIETAVVSFKGRTGVVEPSIGDYTLDTVQAIDKTTSTTYKLVVDNNKLFMEDVSTQERTEIAGKDDLSTLEIQYTTLNDIVTGAVNGLAPRVAALEARPSGGADYSQEISDLQGKDVQLNNLILAVDAKADSTASNTVVIDQRLSILEAKPAAKDYTPEITALSDKNLAQDSRLSAIDGQLINKAPIVNGKVPYENLPEFPVGRKVNVANRAARLALPSYADLTIAYESDTGDAYGLDANADPAITANWSKLGNAQAIGVSSFNGRTGAIGPQSGDYTTGQVTELVDKRYVTSTQITNWEAKPTTEQVDSKIAASNTSINSRLTTVEDLATLANLKGDNAATNILAVDTRLTQVSGTLTSSKMDKTEKGATNGVAPLVGGKLPIANITTNVANGVTALDGQGKIANALLYRGVVNGVASLDASTRVPIAQLPTFMPQSKRVWRDNKRTYNAWSFNTSGNEMEVFIRTNAITDVNSYILINIRENSNFPTLAFSQEYVPQQSGGGNRYLQMQATVPAGWEFAVQIAGGATMTLANISVWRELS